MFKSQLTLVMASLTYGTVNISGKILIIINLDNRGVGKNGSGSFVAPVKQN